MRNNRCVYGLVSVLLIVCFVAGCGYTTRNFAYEQDQVYVAPVINDVQIVTESRKYSNYRIYPLLIEKKLTNALINEFTITSQFHVTSEPENALLVKCLISDYITRALRYTDTDDVREQRIRMYVDVDVLTPDNEVVLHRKVVGETTFFVSGPNKKFLGDAQEDLVQDTARRVVESIVEKW